MYSLVVLMLRFLVVTAESNITNTMMPTNFSDHINKNQSEIISKEFQIGPGSYVPQMVPTQTQINPLQMRRQMQNPMQIQNPINMGQWQYQSPHASQNPQMRGQMDFGAMPFHRQGDSENPIMRNQMNNMQNQFQMNPDPMQFRSQVYSGNPQMMNQMNHMQKQYQMNPVPMQFQSEGNSKDPQLRGQMNSMLRPHEMNSYQRGQKKVPTMQDLSEIIENDFRNQWRSQIEVPKSEEYPQMRSQMNTYQQGNHSHNSSVKRGQRNIYKVYLREENTNGDERQTATIAPNSYAKQGLREATTLTTKLTGIRSPAPTPWEGWIPPHLLSEEYYPDSITPKRKGKGKGKGKGGGDDDGKGGGDDDGKGGGDDDGKGGGDDDGKGGGDDDGKGGGGKGGGGKGGGGKGGGGKGGGGKGSTNTGDFPDGYHPNDNRFDMNATIPTSTTLSPESTTLDLLGQVGKTPVPPRPIFRNPCDDIVHWCMRAQYTAPICARTAFFTYQTFPNYCTMEYANCRQQLEVWMILHMGECYEALPILPGFYSHYAYKDETWLDQYMIEKEPVKK